MVNAKVFKDEVKKLIEKIYETQAANIDATAEIMTNAIKKGGVIHIYGSGHSVGLGIDITDRPGCLVPIHIMEMTDFVYYGGVSVEEFTDKVNIFERRPGMAEKLFNLYDLNENDVFVVISNSGINGIVIDVADLARQRGHKVITITSMTHTLAEGSRHPSGKKLYEFADVVIDNCGPHGDALLETGSIEKVTAVSSIANNVIAHSLALQIIENLTNEGIEAPVLTGDAEKDAALKARYAGRI